MDYIKRINLPSSFNLNESIKLRPGANAGLWCGLTLPVAMCLSWLKYYQIVSTSYSLATLCAIVSTLYIYLDLFSQRRITTHILAVLVALTGCMAIEGNTIRHTSFLILINMKSYSLLSTLLKRFPFSFTIGEAIFVTQGMIVFTFVTIVNCLLIDTHPSTIFCQVFLAGTGLFLLGTSMFEINQLKPYVAFLLTVMGFIVLPAMFFTMGKNPLIWFFSDFIFKDLKRVLLIGYWLLCTTLALGIALRFGSGSSITLTVLRKYFHAIVIAIYLPGIVIDTELLFVASVIVFAAFILLESMRIYKLEFIGDILTKSMTGFLDDKDQGILILTHIYLLVGCSLPIWIFPLYVSFSEREYLLLFSGIVSLGVGDTAASIGGTLWGRTKFPHSSKSVEGTVCSIVAEVTFLYILSYFGILGTSQLPLMACIVSAVVSSLVEAFTTQVDNLVLPLVMYIMVIIMI